MATLATPRLLVGRTIVAVELRPSDDRDVMGKKIRTVYDPCFVLDNGARVYFTVDETDQGDSYGIRPLYTNPTNKRSR